MRCSQPIIPMLALSLLALAACPADEPKPAVLTHEEQKLAAEATTLNVEGLRAYQGGRYPEAVAKWRQELEIRQKLYPLSRYPDGHPYLATNLNNLGVVLNAMGQSEKALGYYQRSLEMRRKLFPVARYADGHPNLANTLHNLGNVLEAVGRAEEALDCMEQSIQMQQKLVQREAITATESAALDLIAQFRRGTSYLYFSVAVQFPRTAAELQALQNRSESRSFVAVSEKEATSARVREALPQARYAHLATHGFFDTESLTAEKKREAEAAKNRTLGDDSRIKVATKNPLGFVGLVLANGEVLSGLSLVDLPLENLKLVTLSACETGLGEYTGGEGVQGLQRAFHLAGCPNVVASLWKVNDAATAALMVKFYHELWVNKKPPIEALREAQLTIYRRPDLIPVLAAERGIKLEKAIESASAQAAGTSESKTPTKLWAAFVLSGVGR